MANILELKETARELVTAWDDADGDIEKLLPLINALEEKGLEAVGDLTQAMEEISIRAEARKSKAARYNELAKKDEQFIDGIKKTIMFAMQTAGIEKFSTEATQITMSKGKESVEVVDEDKVPINYKRVVLTINGSAYEPIMELFGEDVRNEKFDVDKKAITEAHKAGVGVAGTQVIRNPYLIIKG